MLNGVVPAVVDAVGEDMEDTVDETLLNQQLPEGTTDASILQRI